MTRIGILALQGAFAEHAAALERLGVEAVEVRLPSDLTGLDGLIIPGGESTTIGKLMVHYGLLEPVRERAASGFPVWGTCAGMIMLARELDGQEQPLIGTMDIVVKRNAFGRQVESFEIDLPIKGLEQPFRAVFIRAPVIQTIGPDVKPIACLADGTIVAAAQGKMLVTAFHPELTTDTRLHEWFVHLVNNGSAP